MALIKCIGLFVLLILQSRMTKQVLIKEREPLVDL